MLCMDGLHLMSSLHPVKCEKAMHLDRTKQRIVSKKQNDDNCMCDSVASEPAHAPGKEEARLHAQCPKHRMKNEISAEFAVCVCHSQIHVS